MLISLSGQKRTGKDTVADILVRQHKYVKYSLATPLRELCSEVFQIPYETFTDDNTKEKLFAHPIRLDEEHLGLMLSVLENNWDFPVSKESKEKLLQLVGTEMKHPRNILQTMGTEVIRNCIDDQIWLKIADNRIGILADVVIADVRLKNEREWAKNRGAVLCIINRPQLKTQDVHISENDLGNESEYDLILNNTADLSSFQVEVGMFFNNFLSKRRY